MIRAPGFAQLTGLTYRQVDYWTRRGVLIPTQQARGSGSQRLFDELEVRIGAALHAITGIGTDLDVLSEIAEQLRALPEHTWREVVYIEPTHGLLLTEPSTLCWRLDLAPFAIELIPA